MTNTIQSDTLITPNHIEPTQAMDFLDTKNLIFGKRESGKTNLALTIYSTIHHRVHDMYYFSPRDYEFDGIKAHRIEELTYFDQILNHIIEKRNDFRKEGIEYHACIILDDIQLSKEFINSPGFQNIMFNGRQYGITLIICLQYPIGFKPEIRPNFDHIIVASDDNLSNCKKYYINYFPIFPSFDSFKNVFDQVAKTEFLTINNCGYNGNIYEKVFISTPNELENSYKIELLKSMSEFTFYTEKIDNDEDLDLESTEEEWQNIRLEKINEIKYLTSMISYANSRIHQLTEELSQL